MDAKPAGEGDEVARPVVVPGGPAPDPELIMFDPNGKDVHEPGEGNLGKMAGSGGLDPNKIEIF